MYLQQCCKGLPGFGDSPLHEDLWPISAPPGDGCDCDYMTVECNPANDSHVPTHIIPERYPNAPMSPLHRDAVYYYGNQDCIDAGCDDQLGYHCCCGCEGVSPYQICKCHQCIGYEH